MRWLLGLLLALCWTVPVGAETVAFKSGNDTVSGYLAVPKGPGPHPAVVVIHEWWGLNEWVRKEADHRASHGYMALAVDLYRGKVAKDRDTAHELSRGLPQDRALRDLKAAVTYLEGLAGVRKDRIGVMGWCMGGGYALDLAVADPRVRSCIVAYGRVKTEADALKPLAAPVLGIFGADDKGIPPEQIRQFWAAMSEAGKQLELHEFLWAGHAFMNPDNKDGYNKGATDVSHKAVDVFLERTLKR